jgi:hypothetical protein
LADATPVIEAFRQVGHQYEEADHGGRSLDGSAVKLQEIPSPWPNELWILAHGQQSGVMQYHEKVAIYSFDGFQLKDLWVAKASVRDPHFQVTKNALFLTYEDEERIGPPLVKTITLTQAGPMETSTVPKIP